MVNNIKLALLIALCACLASACAPSGRTLKESDLLGGWTTVQNYDATEIYFAGGKAGQNEFSSFLLGRSYESGVWRIKGEDIIVLANGNNTYAFRNAKIVKNMLTFQENGKTAVFHRIIERPAPPAPAADLSSLITRLAKQLPLNFDQPKPASFHWQLDNQRGVEVPGVEIKAAYSVSGGESAENLVSEVLHQNGFLSDSFNVTELISGYRQGAIVAQIFVQDDPDDDTIRYITLRLGECPD